MKINLVRGLFIVCFSVDTICPIIISTKIGDRDSFSLSVPYDRNGIIYNFR